jgi:hypothetical protein
VGGGGGGGGVLVTVTGVLLVVVPPAPVQLKLKVEPVERAPVLAVPLVALLPLQALVVGEALAVQLVALVVLQLRLELAPEAMVAGLAEMVTVGRGGLVEMGTGLDWALWLDILSVDLMV